MWVHIFFKGIIRGMYIVKLTKASDMYRIFIQMMQSDINIFLCYRCLHEHADMYAESLIIRLSHVTDILFSSLWLMPTSIKGKSFQTVSIHVSTILESYLKCGDWKNVLGPCQLSTNIISQPFCLSEAESSLILLIYILDPHIRGYHRLCFAWKLIKDLEFHIHV